MEKGLRAVCVCVRVRAWSSGWKKRNALIKLKGGGNSSSSCVNKYVEEKNEFLSAFFIFLIFFLPCPPTCKSTESAKKSTAAFDTVMLCQKNVFF